MWRCKTNAAILSKHTRMHMHTHTFMHAHTHMHTRIHAHTHTHTHTGARALNAYAGTPEKGASCSHSPGKARERGRRESEQDAATVLPSRTTQNHQERVRPGGAA